MFVLFEAAVPDLLKSFTGVFTVVLEKHLSVVSFPVFEIFHFLPLLGPFGHVMSVLDTLC